MTFNPLKSRRFWTLLIDVIVSTITFIVGLYFDPKTQDIIKFVIVTYQPIVALLIAAYTVDDVTTNVTAIKAGSHPVYKPEQK